MVPRRYARTRRTVEACADCNNHLGGLPLFTEAERRTYLAHRLAAKLDERRGPAWSPQELRDLGPELRATVLSGLAEVKILERRVAFLRRSRI